VHRRRAGHRLGLGAALKVLVLGGTAFLGRHVVEAALERGHEVTMLNRGQTNPDLFPDVERLQGDRNGDLSALRGREWDACVDPSAYYPRQVRATAEVLAGRIGHYTFISSISVYPLDQADKSETAPLIPLEDPNSEDVNKDYGALKAACERVAVDAFGAGNVLNARSGLIVGPWDPTNRFTYWPVRIARGGEVLAPSGPDYRVQYIHARDEADFVLHGAENGTAGTMNVTGPEPAMTLGRLFEAGRSVARSDATFTWVSDEFLQEKQIGPWMELPLWIPPPLGDLHNAPIERALAAGLKFRPVEQTVAETLAWARTQHGAPAPVDSTGRVRPQGGLDPQKERAVLDAWKHARPVG
jgi:2'-hydroxyisoflavone reductase